MRRHGRPGLNRSGKPQLLIRRPLADTFLACGLGHGMALTAHCAVIHYQTAASLPTGKGIEVGENAVSQHTGATQRATIGRPLPRYRTAMHHKEKAPAGGFFLVKSEE